MRPRATGEPLRTRNLYAGSLRILWGFAKKLIIADRLNPLIEAVFNAYGTYDGSIIAAAAILYTMQLYCDFSVESRPRLPPRVH